MVDRHEAARALGVVEPGVGGLSEVDPADVAEHVGVAAVSGDLLAGDERDVAAGLGQPGVVADRVVVGDGQEVEAAPVGQFGQLGDGQAAVAVQGVGVEVAGVPAQAVHVGDVPAGRALAVRRLLGHRLGRRDGVGRDLQRVVQPLRRDPVQAQPDVPRARLGLARQVAGGGPVAGDRVLVAGAARPAAITVRRVAAEVEHALRPVVRQLHVHGGGPGRHLERHLAQDALQPVVQCPVASHTSSPSR